MSATPASAILGVGVAGLAVLSCAMARIRRGGRIIRVMCLHRISEAVSSGVDASRTMVCPAALDGVPTSAFASSLSRASGPRAVLSAAPRLQGLGDFFGARSYWRVDRLGTLRPQWSVGFHDVAVYP